MSKRKMKDSGVEWLGDVPEEWRKMRVRSFLRNVSEKNHPDAVVLSLYRELGVVPKNSRDDNHNVTGEDTSQYKFVQRGDLVINKMKAWQGSLAVSDYEGIVSPAYYVCRFYGEKVSSRFVHYLLRNVRYAQEFERLSTGMRVGQWDLGIDDFLRVPLFLPPLLEQRKIAAYLDGRCAKIDEMISGAKKTIEEYKAWKSSVIFEAVTGKCKIENGECKIGGWAMRDSGVEWIGTVPEGWRVSRIKNEVISLDHLREPISAENRVNQLGLYDYYGASGAIDKIDDYNVDDTVLLIGEDGANLRMRNLPLVYRASGKFWVNNHAHVLKVKEDNDYGYFAYMLESGDYSEYITGTAQPKLSQGNLFAFPVPIPPKKDQRAIAAFLDKKCAAIDRVIAEKESLISDLETYKKSLIFECVTGKMEVA